MKKILLILSMIFFTYFASAVKTNKCTRVYYAIGNTMPHVQLSLDFFVGYDAGEGCVLFIYIHLDVELDLEHGTISFGGGIVDAWLECFKAAGITNNFPLPKVQSLHWDPTSQMFDSITFQTTGDATMDNALSDSNTLIMILKKINAAL